MRAKNTYILFDAEFLTRKPKHCWVGIFPAWWLYAGSSIPQKERILESIVLPLQNKNNILKNTFLGIKSCCRKSNSKSYSIRRFLFLELLVFREINKKFSKSKNQIQNKSTGTPKNIKSSSEKNRFRRKKKVNPFSEKSIQKLSHLNPFCFFIWYTFLPKPFFSREYFQFFTFLIWIWFFQMAFFFIIKYHFLKIWFRKKNYL